MESTTTIREPLQKRAAEYFKELQRTICSALEQADGKERFGFDRWDHPHGGGGVTGVMQDGAVFEKGGVNFSDVQGTLTEKLAGHLNVEPQRFRAAGISLILHSRSPMVPTVHFNLRSIELENGDGWFGGGMDLTPYYLFEDDAMHFHRMLKQACDRHSLEFYRQFKQACDRYFFIKHRTEARGIGGIFFDYLRENGEQTFHFVQEVGATLLLAYLPIVERRKHELWGEREKKWQLHRRGRYVEFNLVYDRGTLFGLETEGRVESILVSLPPSVEWRYNVVPEPGSREAVLLDVLQHPRSWV